MTYYEKIAQKPVDIGDTLLASGLFGNGELKKQLSETQKNKTHNSTVTSKTTLKQLETNNGKTTIKTADSTVEIQTLKQSTNSTPMPKIDSNKRNTHNAHTSHKKIAQPLQLSTNQRVTVISHSNTTHNSNAVDNLDNLPPTKIPERYHVLESTPILPANASDKDLVLDGNTWKRKWFPSARPTDRREVLQLAHTLQLMLQEATNTQQDSATATIEKEQQIYDIILHELIRQVYVECADRGVLLEHVSKRYRSLFRKIPALLSQMQDQIDNLTGANKSLRMVLERLMEEKNSSESKYMESSSKMGELEQQNKQLMEKLELLQQQQSTFNVEYEAMKQEISDLQNKLSFQENQNKILQQQLQESDSSVQSLTKQLEEVFNKSKV